MEHYGTAASIAAAAAMSRALALQTVQLCHDIIKTEYSVLAAPVEPARLKPTMERSRRKKDKAAANDAGAQTAAELP